MTLEEAIIHCIEKSKNCKTECQKEHKQLAEWLKDYKRIKDNENIQLEEYLSKLKYFDDEFEVCRIKNAFKAGYESAINK